jgi:hypothetical protein
MRALSPTLCVGVALMAGALACARNVEETGTARVQDTTAVSDTTQNPPGYRGMEQDTTMVPPAQQQPVDTFLEQQGTEPEADTAGYSGMERDTTMQQDTTTQRETQTDTTGYQPQTDTSGYQPQTDTTSYQPQTDTTGQAGQSDSVRLPHDSTRIHLDSAGVSQPDSGGGQTERSQ